LTGIGLFNALTIILMYAGLPIFGPLNDLGIAAAAIAQATLAWRLQSFLGAAGLRGAVAILGAAIAAVGSALVLSGAANWFVAGLVSMLGYAVLGGWIVSANHRALRTGAWPAELAVFGIVTGAITFLGFAALLALARGVGSPNSAPWYALVAYLNGVGWFILLPIWNFRLGRYLLADPVRARAAPPA